MFNWWWWNECSLDELFRSFAPLLAEDITFNIKTVNIWSNRFSTGYINYHLYALVGSPLCSECRLKCGLEIHWEKGRGVYSWVLDEDSDKWSATYICSAADKWSEYHVRATWVFCEFHVRLSVPKVSFKCPQCPICLLTIQMSKMSRMSQMSCISCIYHVSPVSPSDILSNYASIPRECWDALLYSMLFFVCFIFFLFVFGFCVHI